MKGAFVIISLLILSSSIIAQKNIELEGQVSTILSYSPDNDLDWFSGGRYIPKLSYKIPVDTNRLIDFEVSANFSSSVLFHPYDTSTLNGSITPYRIWARYSGKQYEIRVGLQKINFGSALILRPLQWFNQIDPRDPLQLTNGVYGALGRYYFSNNANVWFWVLYGNEKTRGFDIVETNKKIPEIGGRYQFPILEGEMALTYHYRTARTINQNYLIPFGEIPEHKFGIDGKWDLNIGLWFEASYSHKTKDLGLFTNLSFFNLGTDYTLGLGNGLYVVAEHLFTSFDVEPFYFKNKSNITAITASYPFGFFDNISAVYYYNWTSEEAIYFLNYEHQFKYFTAYLMAYYNPDTQQSIQKSEFVNHFSGPGIRLMMVYNH